MPVASPGIVLVTGGSGYIAGFCIAQLLLDGWHVRTTVRSLAKADQVRANIAKISAGAPSIEFFEADLNSDQGWDRAVAGIDFVLHVASPVTAIDPKSDDELIRPARDGALRVLHAARDAGVKRVVMTSSIAAIVHGHVARASAFTESDWTDETNRADSGPYDRSKTIAERAAWSWRDAQGGTLELVTINPSFVIGPVLGRDFSASLEIVKKLLDGSVPSLPRFGFDLVDVRDIARLHLLAMTTRSAAGQRFIGSGDYYSLKEIAGVLKQGLGKKKQGKCLLWSFQTSSSACSPFSTRLCAAGCSTSEKSGEFHRRKRGKCWVGRRVRLQKASSTQPEVSKQRVWFERPLKVQLVALLALCPSTLLTIGSSVRLWRDSDPLG